MARRRCPLVPTASSRAARQKGFEVKHDLRELAHAGFKLLRLVPESAETFRADRAIDFMIGAVRVSAGGDLEDVGFEEIGVRSLCPHFEDHDGRRKGRTALRHLVECETLRERWQEERARSNEFAKRELAVAAIAVGALPRHAPPRPMISESDVRAWLEDHRGTSMVLPSQVTVIPAAFDASEMPERVAAPVRCVTLLVGRDRTEEVGVVGWRGLAQLSATIAPRRDLMRWMESSDRDLVNSRESLAVDCQRLGARAIVGVFDSLPAEKRDLRAEVEALARRLSELESRAPLPVVESR